MKKGVKQALLGQKSQRRGLRKSQLKSIFTYGKIRVSNNSAKQLARLVDRLITRVEGKDKLASMRYLLSYVSSRALAKQILDYGTLALKKRKSGFTSQTKLGPRRGDAHEKTMIELIDFVYPKPKLKTKPKKEQLKKNDNA
jgi:large subunit ribosomal protein L17